MATPSGYHYIQIRILYTTCSNILDDIKKGNSDVAVYSRSYASLEKAIDSQIPCKKSHICLTPEQFAILDSVSDPTTYIFLKISRLNIVIFI